MESVEKSIFNAAKSVFCRFGFLSTSIQTVADLALTSKTSVHYYYRSKENLYLKVLSDVIKNCSSDDSVIIWFFLVEMQTNKAMFLKTLNKIENKDWQLFINQVIKSNISVAVDAWLNE